MNPTKGSQKITNRRPHPFGGIGMHFTNAITVIISRSFLLPVTDRGMWAYHMIVSLLLVYVQVGSGLGEDMNVVFERLTIAMMNHS